MVPELSFGTGTFGGGNEFFAAWGSSDVAEATRLVDLCLEAGLTLFDSADIYAGGRSEDVLGKAIAGRRDAVLISTKATFRSGPGPNDLGSSRFHLIRAVEGSLKRLGTDYVDAYYLHAPDPKTPIEETVDAMKELLGAGKVRSWGVSNYASWQVLEIDRLCDERGMPRPALSQVVYNLLIRQIEVEYVAFVRRYPIHTTVFNPLAGGLLAGKHRQAEIPRGSRFDNNRMYQRRYWSSRFFELVDAIALVAKSEGMTPVDLAYAWLAGRPGVDSILVGPASVAQLDDAIVGVAKKLSPEALARLDDMHVAFQGTDARYAR